MVKNLSANARDTGEVGPTPGLGRSPRGRSGNAFQYSCLGNSTDRGALQAIVQGITKDLNTNSSSVRDIS